MIDLGVMTTELLRDESNRSNVYDDKTGSPIVPGTFVEGHPTIGIGRALDTNGISADETAYLLQDDIGRTVDALNELDWFVAMDNVRQRAIVNMTFQMGVHGVREFVTMIACIRVQDWEGATRAALNSNWARETPARALRVTALFQSGMS